MDAFDDELDGQGEVEAGPPGDSTRRYLSEIGKARLLTAAGEIELATRVEAGQTELRRALAAVPFAVAALTHLAARVKTRERPLEELVLFPEGEPAPARVRAVMAGLGRVTRLAEAIGERHRVARRRG
ncbi:MAG: hypothetical protein HYR86_06805, partial [Candidatus Rokubacteria bacterium]|nr:hypothetical protein [Candidatus Rokubacteria bacterium]